MVEESRRFWTAMGNLVKVADVRVGFILLFSMI